MLSGCGIKKQETIPDVREELYGYAIDVIGITDQYLDDTRLPAYDHMLKNMTKSPKIYRKRRQKSY